VIQAVIFDLDGVLVDSEQLWDDARRNVVAEHGGQWRDGATRAMQGMSSPEWAAYLHDTLGVDLPTATIVDLVVGDLLYPKSCLEASPRRTCTWTLRAASTGVPATASPSKTPPTACARRSQPGCT
jgi:hypothetical protein